MKIGRLLIQSTTVGLGLIALLLGQGKLFDAVVQQEHQLMIDRLEKTTGDLLENGHRIHDDLTMLAAVRALAKSPGVGFVSVVDPHGKILLDNRPTQLGRLLADSDLTGVQSYPLGPYGHRWGLLVFSLPHEPVDEWQWQHWTAAFVLGAAAWIGFVTYLWIFDKKRTQLESNLRDVTGTLELERQERTQSAAETRRMETQWQSRLRASVEQIPKPTVCLDSRQRVVAVNRSMLEIVHSGDSTEWLGRSWQEIPCLQTCGPALELSLQAPGQEIEVTDPFPKGRLMISTRAESDQLVAGTWITLIRPD